MTRPSAPRRTDFAHFGRVTLRWSDNDVYGHVNNAVYYGWFDSAVNDWLLARGLLDLGGGDPIALVVRTACDYFAPISYPGEVEIGLTVAALGRSSVRYALGVFSPGEELASAAGEFVHVAVDRADRRPVPWPAAWRDALTTLVIPAKAGTPGY